MTEGIVSKSDCAECKICCSFHKSSIWDAPGFTKEEHQAVADKGVEFLFENELYYPVLIKVSDDKYLCPFLEKDGCSLGEQKPFKCKIWPIYIVRSNGELSMAITNVCPVAYPKQDQALLSAIRQKDTVAIIKKEIEKNPALIELPKPHFRIIGKL